MVVVGVVVVLVVVVAAVLAINTIAPITNILKIPHTIAKLGPSHVVLLVRKSGTNLRMHGLRSTSLSNVR